MRYLDILDEAFDQPLPLTYDHERSEEMKARFPNISSVSVYQTSIDGVDLEFYTFKYKDAWEVHFNNRSANFSLETGNTLRGTGMSRVLATVIALYTPRGEKGNIIRYYAEGARLKSLYDRAFQHLNRTRFNSNLKRIDVKDFTTPYGLALPCTLLQLDTRTLKTPEPVIEAQKRLMLEDVSDISRQIKRAHLEGFGGQCGVAAVAINDVVFHGKGKLVGAFNKAFFDKGILYGHVAVEMNGNYWDADARPKPWEEIESWGMLDEDSYREEAEEYDIDWDEDAAFDVIRVEFKDSASVFKYFDSSSLPALTKLLLNN
jgi:hypothetical protein